MYTKLFNLRIKKQRAPMSFLLVFCLTMLSFSTSIKAQTHLYVDSSNVSSGNGTSWSAAYQRLTSALNEANSGSGNYVIHVAQGTYLPTKVDGTIATSRDSSFTIFRKGISILGGYSAGGGTRNSKQYVTRISGDIGTVGVMTDNLYHVLVLAINTNSADSLIIDGVNIESGYANSNSTTVINGVAFPQNTGGGVFVKNSSGSTINKVYLNNCLIQNNYASLDGGGMENYNCTLTMIGSCIYNNTCVEYGGGLNNEAGGSLILINDVFTNNANPSSFGGGLRVSGSSTNQIINCTFTNNIAGTGGAIRVASLGTATVNIHNSIFRGNHSGSDYTSTNADVSNGATLFIDTSCLQSSQSCTGCLVANTNPQFTDLNNPLGNDGFFGTADDGITLTDNSPCINVGNDGIVNVYGLTNDIVGSQRIRGTHVDFGAYESGPIASIVTNGGFGTVYLCSGIPGNTNSFNISGSALTSDITITAPTGFVLSTSSNSGYSSSPLVLTQTNGIVPTTTVYIQVASNAVGTFSGTIDATSTGATTQSLPITAIVDVTSSSSSSVTSCTNYTWSVNSQTYTTSGTYVSVTGCHTDTLHLTISNTPISDTTHATTCNNYTWSANGQSYSTSGTYTYSPSGCVTHTLILTINAGPTVTATANTAICIGQSVTLSGSGATSYSWDNGVSNGVSFMPSTTTTYTVTGTTNGCSNTAQTTVTVNPLPTVNAGADTTICPGSSTKLTATGAISYSWTGGVTNGTSFSPSTTATYVVTGTNANNCSNTDTAVVYVRTFDIISSGPRICKGLSVLLTAPAGSSYLWKKNSGYLKTQTNRTMLVTKAGVYSVKYTDSLCGLKITPTVTLIVQPNPAQQTLTASSTALCPNATTTLTVSGTFPNYQWFVGTTQILGVNTNTYTTPNTGLYKVRAVDSFGCLSPYSSSKNITAKSAPVPVITITNATLGAKKLTSVKAATYQWRLNGANISGATTQNYIATQSGAYSITITNTPGCIATSSDTSLIITYTGPRMNQDELAVINDQENIKVYPNPSNGIFYIDAPEATQVIVTDIQGRKVLEINNLQQVDLSSHPSGIYFLQLINEEGMLLKTEKLIKQ